MMCTPLFWAVNKQGCLPFRHVKNLSVLRPSFGAAFLFVAEPSCNTVTVAVGE